MSQRAIAGWDGARFRFLCNKVVDQLDYTRTPSVLGKIPYNALRFTRGPVAIVRLPPAAIIKSPQGNRCYGIHVLDAM